MENNVSGQSKRCRTCHNCHNEITKTCKKCLDRSSLWKKEHSDSVKKHRTVYNKKNPSVVKNLSAAHSKRLRIAVLAFLGNKCCRCGFNDPRALQIDHVNGGGKQELKNVSRHTYYRKVLADTQGRYQLLCANCNWIKRTENGETS